MRGEKPRVSLRARPGETSSGGFPLLHQCLFSQGPSAVVLHWLKLVRGCRGPEVLIGSAHWSTQNVEERVRSRGRWKASSSGVWGWADDPA